MCASGRPSPVPPYAGCALFYLGVGDDGKTRTHEARRRWGKDSFLPPNRVPPEHPSRKGGECEEKRHTKYLGASSPSGNARGRLAEGASPFGTERTLASNARDHILFSSFLCLRFSCPYVSKRSARPPPRRPFHSKKIPRAKQIKHEKRRGGEAARRSPRRRECRSEAEAERGRVGEAPLIHSSAS